MTFFAILLIIALFTILPLIGVYIASELWNLDTSGMFVANFIHVCIIYIGAVFAIKEIKTKKYGWVEDSSVMLNTELLFSLILRYSIIFSIIVFFFMAVLFFLGYIEAM